MKPALFVLLALAAFAQSPSSGAKSAFDKATLEKYLRRIDVFAVPVEMKIDDPKPSADLPGFSEVAVHITAAEGGGSKEELYYVSRDGQTIIQGDPTASIVFHINQSPFQGNLAKLHTENAPSFGPANAPVTIVEFGDLECPSCRAEAPVLRQIMPQTYPTQVRVVFKDFPLESIHPWARAASIAARCVYRQNPQAFWKFYDWMYEVQDDITPDSLNAKAKEWAGSNGIDPAQFGSCVDTKATDADVARNIAEGHALGVKGTPSLFINGHKIGGVEWEVLKKLIDTELEYAKAK